MGPACYRDRVDVACSGPGNDMAGAGGGTGVRFDCDRPTLCRYFPGILDRAAVAPGPAPSAPRRRPAEGSCPISSFNGRETCFLLLTGGCLV